MLKFSIQYIHTCINDIYDLWNCAKFGSKILSAVDMFLVVFLRILGEFSCFFFFRLFVWLHHCMLTITAFDSSQTNVNWFPFMRFRWKTVVRFIELTELAFHFVYSTQLIWIWLLLLFFSFNFLLLPPPSPLPLPLYHRRQSTPLPMYAGVKNKK